MRKRYKYFGVLLFMLLTVQLSLFNLLYNCSIYAEDVSSITINISAPTADEIFTTDKNYIDIAGSSESDKGISCISYTVYQGQL